MTVRSSCSRASIFVAAFTVASGCAATAPPQPAAPPVVAAPDYSELSEDYCTRQFEQDGCYLALISTGWNSEQRGEPARAYRAYNLADLSRPGDQTTTLRKESARRAAAKTQQARLDHSARPATLRIVVELNGPRNALDRLELLVDFEPIVWHPGEPLAARALALLPGPHDVMANVVVRRAEGTTRMAEREAFTSNSEPIDMRVAIDVLAKRPQIKVTREPLYLPEQPAQ